MKRVEIENLLNSACSALYEYEYDLVKNKAHERTLAGTVFCHIRKSFQDAGWDVDLEYNREGDQADAKGDDIGNMVPDIVVHTREEILGPNLLAIEIKGYWNKADRLLDQNKLRRLRSKYKYEYLYQIEFNVEDWVLTEVDPLQAE